MAYDAFLSVDGVNGDSTRQGFEGQIEVTSFSWGAVNPVTMGPGGGSGAGKAELSTFNIAKYTDSASPALFQACASGKHFPNAKLTLHKAAGDDALDYLVYEFDHVYVESINWSGAAGTGDDTPQENLSLAFGKVTITYTPQSEAGEPGTPVVASWDQQAVSR